MAQATTMDVADALAGQGANPTLSNGEIDLCRVALYYGVGAYDCAAQIIADRADAAGLTVQPQAKAIDTDATD